MERSLRQSAPAGSGVNRTKDLYKLYRDERMHEERTKHMLLELERNSQQLQQSKMRLVEKLLDIRIKDDLAKQKASSQVPLADINSQIIKENARRRIMSEVQANVQEARSLYHGGFISELDALVHMDDDEARKEVRDTVSQYVDPHIELFQRGRRRDPDVRLTSIEEAARYVKFHKERELDDAMRLRERHDHAVRVQRVDNTLKLFKKPVGDLTPLLAAAPEEYRTNIGKREAEINDLRELIASQRAEEERLLQERQAKLALIDADQTKLTAEVEDACQKLLVLQRELESKELDLKEMAASQAPGSGKWATDTMQLERDLSYATEEEFHLRQENEEMKKALDVLQTEKAALDLDVSEGIAELTKLQEEHSSVTNKLEDRVGNDKQRLYTLREQENEVTKAINNIRYRITHRTEDIRRQKREMRSVINTTIAQLSIEDRMQSALMAKSMELQKSAEKARSQSDHQVSSLNSQLERLNTELKNKNSQISALAEKLTDYIAGRDHTQEVRLTAAQLQAKVDQLTQEWSRIEWETASSVARVASRLDLNTRENERLLKQMGRYVVMQEDVRAEGIDIENTTTEDCDHVREELYSDLTQRAYREAKYSQTIRLFKDRQGAKVRGEAVAPLTKNRRLTTHDRKARREAVERSNAARKIAIDQLRARGGSVGGDSAASGGGGPVRPQPSNAEKEEFRMRVINYIKDEIQPLYDTNQITKRRFVDIVARVSSWYLETHSVAQGDFTQSNISDLVRKIQEVIRWQDDERLKARAESGSRSVAYDSPAPHQ